MDLHRWFLVTASCRCHHTRSIGLQPGLYFRQQVKLDPIPVLPQVHRHLVAGVALRAPVADHVDHSGSDAAGIASRPGGPGTAPYRGPAWAGPG